MALRSDLARALKKNFGAAIGANAAPVLQDKRGNCPEADAEGSKAFGPRIDANAHEFSKTRYETRRKICAKSEERRIFNPRGRRGLLGFCSRFTFSAIRLLDCSVEALFQIYFTFYVEDLKISSGSSGPPECASIKEILAGGRPGGILHFLRCRLP